MTRLAFDHVGIVVRDCDEATQSLATLVGATYATARFDDPVLTVSVRFLLDRSGVVFELIAPFGSPSVVDTVLKKGTSIINQVAYRTDDLAAAGEELVKQGCMPIGEAKPARAFGGALVQFYLSRLGFIIEVIEAATHQHDFKPITLS